MSHCCSAAGLIAATLCVSCGRSPDAIVPVALPVSSPVVRPAPVHDAPAAPSAASTSAPRTFDTVPYAWLQDGSSLSPVDDLEARIAPPTGFDRVVLEPGSFGAWLRRLPLAASGTPVRKFSGSVLLEADHENVAAVVAIDAGKTDLMQCADSVMRMHAEWLWSKGRRDMSYQAASGLPLPYERWARGERIVQKGQSIAWVPQGRGRGEEHGSFRAFLDQVFAWANTVSLDRQAQKVALDDLRPGDVVVMPGNPGHAVLFLDLARSADGRRVVLLGQGYMPAQGFYVLRPDRAHLWFEIEPSTGAIATPFWRPFPWSQVRRLGE